MVQESVVADFIAFGISRRKARQQHGAQSNAQKRRWEFHQTVGVIEPRHGAMPEPARNVGVDEDGELRHAHTENSRGHQSEYAPHGGVAEALFKRARTHKYAKPRQCKYLSSQLQYAPEHNGGGKRPNGFFKSRREHHRADNKGEIEQNRRGRRNRKLLERIEDARRERHQAHESNVGKHHTRERRCQIKGLRCLTQTARNEPHEKRRG